MVSPNLTHGPSKGPTHYRLFGLCFGIFLGVSAYSVVAKVLIRTLHTLLGKG